MHPGNMLVAEDGAVVALDFGIMGRLDLATRRNLALILLGFLTRDYVQVADVFFRIGMVPRDQDRAAFTQACRAIGEPIFDRPLNEISFGRLLGQLLHVAEQFDMESKPELLLLQKTMVVAEGVGRALNPNVNMWQLAQPLVEDWMRANLGPEAQMREALADVVDAARLLPTLVREANSLAESLAARETPPPGRGVSPWWLVATLALGLVLGLALG
jgi:ubiquinone biosynthesis protein